MSAQREPTVVQEARQALQDLKRWTILPAALMCLGWVPLLFIEDAIGRTGVLIFMAVYLLICLVGTGAITWKTEQTRWARDLVDSWSRAQADATLQGAMREEGMLPAKTSTSSAVIMGRIREHLEMDARALRAAEEAYAHLNQLRTEEVAALQALQALPEGPGRTQLENAHQALIAEAEEIEGSLAALYATLLTREAQPTFNGLKNTMLELEAEAEVAETTAAHKRRMGQQSAQRDPSRGT